MSEAGQGDIYALRGYCNDLLGNRVLAIKDYSLSLNRRLSEQVKPSVEANIKPMQFKDIGLVMDKVKLAENNSMESSKSAVIKEYLKFLINISQADSLWHETSAWTICMCIHHNGT